jgi:hypothetical protein
MRAFVVNPAAPRGFAAQIRQRRDAKEIVKHNTDKITSHGQDSEITKTN